MNTVKHKPLSDRQERFVHEYLIDHNATAAAGRAGYSASTKGTQAARLMQDARVKQRIAEELGALFARLNLKAFEVLRGQVRAAFLDPAKLFDAAQDPLPLDALDEETRGGISVSYAKRRDGDYTLRVKQTPRHVAFGVLQKRLDEYAKLQAQALAEVAREEEEQEAPARAASIFSVPLQLDGPQEAPSGHAALAQADRALAEAAQALGGEVKVVHESHPHPNPPLEREEELRARSARHAMPPTRGCVDPLALKGREPSIEAMKEGAGASALSPAVAEDGDAPPPSPFEPGYDFKKDPNALYGGRFTAWNKYWREKREQELMKAEEQAAQLNPPPNFRVGPGKTVPVRMEPGYNPPWLRNNRQEYAIGAGECWID